LLQKFQKVWLQSLCRTFAGELMDSLYIAYEPPPPTPRLLAPLFISCASYVAYVFIAVQMRSCFH
jgi:hypothetical protein